MSTKDQRNQNESPGEEGLQPTPSLLILCTPSTPKVLSGGVRLPEGISSQRTDVNGTAPVATNPGVSHEFFRERSNDCPDLLGVERRVRKRRVTRSMVSEYKEDDSESGPPKRRRPNKPDRVIRGPADDQKASEDSLESQNVLILRKRKVIRHLVSGQEVSDSDFGPPMKRVKCEPINPNTDWNSSPDLVLQGRPAEEESKPNKASLETDKKCLKRPASSDKRDVQSEQNETKKFENRIKEISAAIVRKERYQPPEVSEAMFELKKRPRMRLLAQTPSCDDSHRPEVNRLPSQICPEPKYPPLRDPFELVAEDWLEFDVENQRLGELSDLRKSSEDLRNWFESRHQILKNRIDSMIRWNRWRRRLSLIRNRLSQTTRRLLTMTSTIRTMTSEILGARIRYLRDILANGPRIP